MIDDITVSESGYLEDTDEVIDGTTTLSDHDFVFADLQFDFDAVLKDTWEEPATVN